MTTTLLRYPGEYCAVHLDATTRACHAPEHMIRAQFIFALVTPSKTQASILYARTDGVTGDTARPLATVADFAVGTWILVEQAPDDSGAGALWRLACVGEWANP